MEPVVRACAIYLADNLNIKNCIGSPIKQLEKHCLGVRKQANFNNDTNLMVKVDRFIRESFENIVNESVEFTQLPCIKVYF